MRIGPYEVTSTLGQGGMGVVYGARSPDGRPVAVKVLRKNEGEVLARFERERRLLASLGEAEGFVPLLDAGTTQQGPYLVMPLVPGGTLRKRLDKGPLGVDETVTLGRRLARAVGEAHARGVVHRDLKPENVLFTAEGVPLLADVGLAKHFDLGAPGASQSVSLTHRGALRGTAGYMAPEQMVDAKGVGPAADVFALGVILYECLAGEPPFVGQTFFEVIARVGDGRFEPLALRRPEAPAWLAGAVEGALARAAWDRFPDGRALAAALGPADPAAPPRRLAPILAGAGLLGLAIGGLALALARRSEPVAVPPPVNVIATPPLPVAPPVASGPALPRGLRLAGRKVPAADRKEVELYLWKLPGEAGDVELVSVPAGDFTIGVNAPEDVAYLGEPKHRQAFPDGCWIGRTDVTSRQYLAFVNATRRTAPEKPFFWDSVAGTKDDHPVVLVSWEEARAYAAWAGLALPSEVEWEKAARGTDERTYPWGNDWDPRPPRCNFADADCPLDSIQIQGMKTSEWFELHGWEWDREHHDGYAFTSPVGSFPRGASPCGALDMAGNVAQWCEDRFDGKKYDVIDARVDAAAPIGTLRVVRGASWRMPAAFVASYYRHGCVETFRDHDLGFRVVLRP
jgi:formylglycine-generating enzyme required for sulfatase activity